MDSKLLRHQFTPKNWSRIVLAVIAHTVQFPFVVSAKLSDSLLSPQNGEVDPAVKALEARQDEIMRKLYELKAAVEGLAKTVTTPDADLDLTVSSSLSSSCTTFKGVTDLDTLLGKVRWFIRHEPCTDSVLLFLATDVL